MSGGVAAGAPLRFAYAGFIAYVDTNGNGRLDFGEAGTAGDRLVGGSDNLGAVPHEGYNLRFTDASDRWFPLDGVELELQPTPMPSSVCERMTAGGGLPTHFATDAGVSVGCLPGGRQYVLTACTTQDPAQALCNTGLSNHMTTCISADPVVLEAGAPIPRRAFARSRLSPSLGVGRTAGSRDNLQGLAADRGHSRARRLARALRRSHVDPARRSAARRGCPRPRAGHIRGRARG